VIAASVGVFYWAIACLYAGHCWVNKSFTDIAVVNTAVFD